MGDLARNLKKAQPRILTIDLERLPGEVTMDVWEPRDFRRVNYVHPDRWHVLPRTLCASGHFMGDRGFKFVAAWEQPDDPWHVARALWSWLSDADYCVTFNGNNADLKWLRSDWVMAGLPLPAPYRSIDLYTIARREFSFESKSLRHLCDRLGIENKDGHYNAAEAKAAMSGDVKAQARLRRYNRQDVKVTELAFERLRPYLGNALNWGLTVGDDLNTRCCPTCGCEQLEPAGYYETGVTRYTAWRCTECLAIMRSKSRSASVTMRGVR
jgi:hypothetical protein